MAAIEAICIDDGGVLNDNKLRGPQWQRLVAEYLAPRLGGDRAAWGEANKIVAERQFTTFAERFSLHPDYSALWYEEELEWLRDMCQMVGVATPDGDEACWRLARATSAWVTRRVRSAIPGAVEALHALHDAGYTLHTASGSNSHDLEGILIGAGVRRLFKRLYGPDLTNAWKGSSLYYERIFADAGVSPSNALVVDDSIRAVGWAKEAGAEVVLVSRDAPPPAGTGLVIGSLSELPSLLIRR